MYLNPYLFFDGRCEEAFKFYEKALGGEIKGMLTYAGSPGAELVPEAWRKKIMHGTVTIGGQALMGSDGQPGHYHPPQGFSVSLAVDTVADAERVFEALAEDGEVLMALQQTFWAARFGMLSDRFGIPWMINCEKDAE
jgi:PhnB protein